MLNCPSITFSPVSAMQGTHFAKILAFTFLLVSQRILDIRLKTKMGDLRLREGACRKGIIKHLTENSDSFALTTSF